MGLSGPVMVEAAYILRILSWAILARAVTSAMSPLVIISSGQVKALGLTLFSVTANVILVLWLVPRFGVLGVALAFLCVEFLFSMLPTILLSQHLASVRMNWLPVLKASLSAVFALICTTALGQKGTIWSAAIAVLIYLSLTVFTGALSLSKLHTILESIKDRMSVRDDSSRNSTEFSGPQEHE